MLAFFDTRARFHNWWRGTNVALDPDSCNYILKQPKWSQITFNNEVSMYRVQANVHYMCLFTIFCWRQAYPVRPNLWGYLGFNTLFLFCSLSFWFKTTYMYHDIIIFKCNVNMTCSKKSYFTLNSSDWCWATNSIHTSSSITRA